MLTLGIAPYILFPALGLVALAMGLLSRRYSAAALALGLTGLLALTAASTSIVTAPATAVVDPTKVDQVAEPLKETIAQLRHQLESAQRSAVKSTPTPTPTPAPTVATPSEIAQLQAKLDQARTELEQTQSEHRAEQNRREEAERKREAAERASAEAAIRTADLVQKIGLSDGRIAELESKLGAAQAGLGAARTEIAGLKKELEKQPPSSPPDPARIREKLASGDASHWTAHPERGLIAGRRGSWYVVRLLQGGAGWDFPDREFALADTQRIAASAARLREDVLRPLSKAGIEWRLYARGAADARPVAGPAGREVSYHPLKPDGTYPPQAEARARIPVRVQNDELPTLRADWLRQIVHPVIGAAGATDIAILENPPRAGHGRKAELVLYVEWPSPPR